MTPEEHAKLNEIQKSTQLRIARANNTLNRIGEIKKIIQALSKPLELHENSAGQLNLYGRQGMALQCFAFHRDDAVHFRNIIECEILPRLEAEYESI